MDTGEADKRIKSGLASGDPSSLDMLWEAYAGGLFAFALALLCSKADAEDAMHELFLKIARKRHSVAKVSNLKAYLFGMMRNLVWDFVKRRRRDAAFAPGENEWLLACEGTQEREELRRELEAALKELPEEQRSVLVLKAYKEMSFIEIAEALDISQNTAASRYRYGLKKLRETFGE